MVIAGTYPARTDAELAQSALEAAGIESVIAADDAGGAYPFDLSGGCAPPRRRGRRRRRGGDPRRPLVTSGFNGRDELALARQ
jgi:hypothetical protein